MTTHKRALIFTLLFASLLGCAKQNPSGQIVASVSGQDVTLVEVKHEMQTDSTLSQAEAIQVLVDRKIIATKAIKQGLERDEDFHFSARRSRDTLLSIALREDLAKEIESVEDSEIWILINREPWRYTQRLRLYVTRSNPDGSPVVAWVDTYDFRAPPPVEVLEAQEGDVLLFNNQEWIVKLREEKVLEPHMIFEQARHIREEQIVDELLADLVTGEKESGNIVYQEGFGPRAKYDNR